MNSLQQAIIYINSLSVGILLPVFNLILLQRGSSLQTLPLLFAVYSASVLCMELPSGICADMFGRKRVFLAACGFQIISLCILAAAGNMVWLLIAVVFQGLGRAFSSGSLDALFVDQALELHGEGCLTAVSARMALLDAAGLAIGGIAGGIAAGIGGTYLANIALRIMLTAILLVLCLFLVKESHVRRGRQHISLMEHVKKGGQVVASTREFPYILMGTFFVGIILSVIETYWQPAFMHIAAGSRGTWMLGIITFSGFIAVTAGNLAAEKLLNRYSSWWGVYIISHFIFSCCMLLFALQKNIVSFIVCYSGTYLLLGAGSVAENALTNKLTPSRMRASMFSLKSLILQLGGLSASLFSSFAIKQLQITGIWIAAGSLLGVFAVASALMTAGKERKKCSVKSIT